MPMLAFSHMSAPGAIYSGERLVNYFARAVQDAVAPVALIGRSGLVEHASLGSGPVRAAVTMGGALYAACGGKVWKVSSGVATQVGTITDGVTYMAASFDEVAVVVGGKYYICDGATTTAYSTGAVTTPVSVDYKDGYFVVVGSDANRGDILTISGLDDGTTFNALEFAYAEESADDAVSVFVDHSDVLVFGYSTVQVFYNSGDADFPFTVNKGATIQHGCLSGKTVAAADNGVFWVRPDGAVLRYPGSSPQIISTPEIKEALAGSVVTGGFTFTDKGHEFYAVTRDGETTLVFDLVMGAWHERAAGVAYAPWHPTCRVTMGGVEYFGTKDGRFALQSATVFDDFGDEMAAEAVSLPIENGGDWFRLAKVHINAGGGRDLSGATPQAMLQTSKDGRIFGAEKWRPLGRQGEYWKRAVWHSLGAFRRCQVRLRITDPVPRDIYGVRYE